MLSAQTVPMAAAWMTANTLALRTTTLMRVNIPLVVTTTARFPSEPGQGELKRGGEHHLVVVAVVGGGEPLTHVTSETAADQTLKTAIQKKMDMTKKKDLRFTTMPSLAAMGSTSGGCVGTWRTHEMPIARSASGLSRTMADAIQIGMSTRTVMRWLARPRKILEMGGGPSGGPPGTRSSISGWSMIVVAGN